MIQVITTPPETIIATKCGMLWPELWPHGSDEWRYGYGIRDGRFAAGADTDQAPASRELIEADTALEGCRGANRSVMRPGR